MQREIKEEEVIRDFRHGLEDHEIYMCYQPQYNHSTGRMIGAEALMRWNHSVYGPQFPAAFISMMEKNGLIHKADLYAFEEICRFLRKCIDLHIPLMPISFNIGRAWTAFQTR